MWLGGSPRHEELLNVLNHPNDDLVSFAAFFCHIVGPFMNKLAHPLSKCHLLSSYVGHIQQLDFNRKEKAR